MSRSVRLGLAAVALLAPTIATAKVRIAVDLDAQTIHVEAHDKVFDWKVSSGKRGFETPAGKFGVLWMDKDHHSDTYEQAWMPNAIFFAPGYAIHGFGKSPWGHKASHGCVRLPADKAALLFDLVKAEGAEITITGASPVVAPTVASVRAKQRETAAAEATDGYADPAVAYAGRYAGQGDAAAAPQPHRDGLFGFLY